MRRFADAEGRVWEVVAGRESWGALFAIFIPVESGPDLRQTPLPAQSYEEATLAFDAMSDAELLELLDRSVPKTM